MQSGVETIRRTITDDILPRLADWYRERGLTLEWDEAVVERLVERTDGVGTVRELERVVEGAVGPG